MSPWTSKNGKETLGNLREGCQAAVTEVCECERAELRLQELGFVPGTPVEVLCQGETMLVRLGDQRLSLRRESAEAVSVYPLA